MRIRELVVFCLLGLVTVSATCPKQITTESFREVCQHDEVNVTMLRCLHDFGDEVYINYTVERTTFVPITIDVRLEGQTSKGFRCRNGNITDSVTGMVIVRVLFESNCLDPVVGINMAAMVNLTVEISVNVTDTFLCNTFAIGPQTVVCPADMKQQVDCFPDELLSLLVVILIPVAAIGVIVLVVKQILKKRGSYSTGGSDPKVALDVKSPSKQVVQGGSKVWRPTKGDEIQTQRWDGSDTTDPSNGAPVISNETNEPAAADPELDTNM